MELFLFIIGFIYCVIVGFIAKDKGRSFLNYFFLSILFTPIVGVICVVVKDPDYKKIDKDRVKSGKAKECGYCLEVIKLQASVCKHCGRDVIGNA